MPMPPRQETDLTDRRWAANSSLVPAALTDGWPRRAAMREQVDAILYALCAGRASRLPPHDFTTRLTLQIVKRVPPRFAIAAAVTPLR